MAPGHRQSNPDIQKWMTQHNFTDYSQLENYYEQRLVCVVFSVWCCLVCVVFSVWCCVLCVVLLSVCCVVFFVWCCLVFCCVVLLSVVLC